MDYDASRHPELIFRLRALGASQTEIVSVLGISPSTYDIWVALYPEVQAAYEAGGVEADGKVAAALYKRATGFTKAQVKIFQHKGEPVVIPYDHYYPPDVNAALAWLYNRRPGDWRPKTDVAVAETGVVQSEEMSPDEWADKYQTGGMGPPAGTPESVH